MVGLAVVDVTTFGVEVVPAAMLLKRFEELKKVGELGTPNDDFEEATRSEEPEVKLVTAPI